MKNGHIAVPHKPPMFLCSVLQEDHQAFYQDLDSAAVQSLRLWPVWICARPPGCHQRTWLSRVPKVETLLEVLFFLNISPLVLRKTDCAQGKE